MPGHIKLVKGAVDPDPTEFLWPSLDMKKNLDKDTQYLSPDGVKVNKQK